MGGKGSKDKPLPGGDEPETWPHGLRVLRAVAEICAAVTSVAEHHSLKKSQDLLDHANTIEERLQEWDGKGLDQLRGVQVTKIASALEIFERELRRTYTKVQNHKEKRFVISKRRLSGSLERALGKVNTDYLVFKKVVDAVLLQSLAFHPEDGVAGLEAGSEHSPDSSSGTDKRWEEDGEFEYDDSGDDGNGEVWRLPAEIDSGTESSRGDVSGSDSEQEEGRQLRNDSGVSAGGSGHRAQGKGSPGSHTGNGGPASTGNPKSIAGDSDTVSDEASVDLTRIGSIRRADPTHPVPKQRGSGTSDLPMSLGEPRSQAEAIPEAAGFEFSPGKSSQRLPSAAQSALTQSADYPPNRPTQVKSEGIRARDSSNAGTGLVTEDPQELLRELILRADNGDPEAAFEAACLCREGQLIECDAVAALEYMRIAAESDHLEACYQMGCMAEQGEGLAVPDLQEAAAWYRKAAFSGHTQASAAFGRALEMGTGTDQNLEAAAAWYKRAATAGSGRAANNLGKMYFDGRGVREDRTVAAAWFKYAVQCQLDTTSAAFNNLGICHEDGLGLEVDMEAASECYQQAANLDHVGALVNLAHLQLRRGDFPSARMSFELAATHGNADALYSLACLLERQAMIVDEAKSPGHGMTQETVTEGDGGAADSVTQLYQRAASAGDPRAQHWLALWYWDEGMIDEALAMFHLAASKHHAPSLNSLGIIAEEGQGGCDQDLEAAWECYRLAAIQGSAEASANLKALEEVLDVSDTRSVLQKEGFKLKLIGSDRHPARHQ